MPLRCSLKTAFDKVITDKSSNIILNIVIDDVLNDTIEDVRSYEKIKSMTLHMKDTGGLEKVNQIVEILKSYNIYSLKLKDNGIEDSEIYHIAHILPFTNVKYLDISYNNLGPDSCFAISHIFRNSNLAYLDLSYNAIGNMAFKLLNDEANMSNSKYISKIVDLNLSHCDIDCYGAQWLLDVLSRTPILHLDLSGNDIAVSGFGYERYQSILSSNIISFLYTSELPDIYMQETHQNITNILECNKSKYEGKIIDFQTKLSYYQDKLGDSKEALKNKTDLIKIIENSGGADAFACYVAQYISETNTEINDEIITNDLKCLINKIKSEIFSDRKFAFKQKELPNKIYEFSTLKDLLSACTVSKEPRLNDVPEDTATTLPGDFQASQNYHEASLSGTSSSSEFFNHDSN